MHDLKTTNMRILFLFTLLLAVIGSVHAAHTEVFIDDRLEDFAQGDLTTATLTYDATLLPPLFRQRVADVDADVVWDVATSGNDRFVATGHEGKVFRVTAEGRPELLHQFEETTVYAILPASDGQVLAAASPGGRIYAVGPDGSAKVFADTGSRLLWDLVRHDGNLYAATGSDAGIIRIADDGTTSTLLMMPQVLNVLDLAPLARDGALAVATQGPGLLCRVTANGELTVLLDPQQEEIRRVAVMPDGSIIGAVNGSRSPGEDVLSRTPDQGQKGGNNKPRPESFVVRAYPDGFAEEMWVSPESPIHDLYVRPDGSLIVAAGNTGTVYEVTPDGLTNRAGVTDEDFITRLAPGPDGTILMGTGMSASVYTVDPGRFGEGIYQSRVFDGKGAVQWSRVRAVLNTGGGAIRVSTRSGNTAKPDDTWNKWMEPADFAAGEQLARSPVARFLQYRLDFTPAVGGIQPTVDIVRIFYTRPNGAPVVREVTVAPGPIKPNNNRPEMAPPGRVQPFAATRLTPAALDITWKPEDPDGDRLLFDVYIRPVDETDWVLVSEDWEQPTLTLDTAQIPDGEYRARIVARDDADNSAADARDAYAESAPFIIDNSGPAIIDISTDKGDAIRVRVEDSTSLIAGLTWRSGFDEFQFVTPDDDALDQRSEVFTIKLDTTTSDFITLIAIDELENRTVVRIPRD